MFGTEIEDHPFKIISFWHVGKACMHHGGFGSAAGVADRGRSWRLYFSWSWSAPPPHFADNPRRDEPVGFRQRLYGIFKLEAAFEE